MLKWKSLLSVISVALLATSIAGAQTPSKKTTKRPTAASERAPTQEAQGEDQAPDYDHRRRASPKSDGRLQTTMYQPEAGAQSLTFNFMQVATRADLNGAEFVKADTNIVQLRYLVGASKNWSFGVDTLGYAMGKNTINFVGTTTSEPKGMQDLGVTARGYFAGDLFDFYAGGRLAVSLGKAESSVNAQAGNMFSGGTTIEPYAGVAMRAGPGQLGFTAKYSLVPERTVSPVDGTASTKSTNQATTMASLFYEAKFDNFFVTPELNIQSAAAYTQDKAGVKTDIKARGAKGFGLQMGYRFNDSTLVSLSYTDIKFDDELTTGTVLTSSINAKTLALAGRLTF